MYRLIVMYAAVMIIMLIRIKGVVKLKLLSLRSTDHAGGSWSTFSRKELGKHVFRCFFP